MFKLKYSGKAVFEFLAYFMMGKNFSSNILLLRVVKSYGNKQAGSLGING
jgi:hypothetical protein